MQKVIIITLNLFICSLLFSSCAINKSEKIPDLSFKNKKESIIIFYSDYQKLFTEELDEYIDTFIKEKSNLNLYMNHPNTLSAKENQFIFCNRNIVKELCYGSYSIIRVSPGEYLFSINNGPSITITVLPNQIILINESKMKEEPIEKKMKLLEELSYKKPITAAITDSD